MINEKGMTGTAKDIKNFKSNKETFEIKDLKIGQQGTYKQFLGNSIDDGRRLLFISFDNDYCAVVTDTEWHSKKEGNLRQLKVTDLFISKQLHDTEIKDLQGAYDIALNEMNMKDKEIEANNKYIRNLIFSSNQISMDNKHILEKRVSELQAENEKLNYAIKRFNEEDMK